MGGPSGTLGGPSGTLDHKRHHKPGKEFHSAEARLGGEGTDRGGRKGRTGQRMDRWIDFNTKKDKRQQMILIRIYLK